MIRILVFLATTLALHSAQAKEFKNAYISFDLPEHWDCDLAETEWICKSRDQQQSRQSIIIFTAKEVGPTDTFEAYKRHLQTPQTTRTKKGQMLTSQVVHTKGVKINNQTWVDGWHLNSEIPNHYTRYLATIKNKIAVLITFSAHRLHYTKYNKDFFNAIKSLKITATPNMLLAGAGGAKGAGGGYAGAANGQGLANMPGGEVGQQELASSLPNESHGSSGNMLIYLALAVLLGGAGFMILKKKKGA